MSEYTISVIVPVYNVEAYLRKCIDSIISQSFTNWELLLIDDGSLDNSGSICDEYQLIDKRIKVYHKANGGVSSARNFGLNKASGKWISFIDADDFVSPNYLMGILKPLTLDSDIDLVQGGCVNWIGGKVAGINQVYEDFIGTQPEIIFNKFRGLAVSKLFKRDAIIKGNDGKSIKFDENMKIAEDMAFTIDYLLTVKKFAFVSEVGYYYRKDNQNSATNRIRAQVYDDNLYGWKHLWVSSKKFIDLNKLEDSKINYRLNVLADILYSTICSLRYLPLSVNKKVFKLSHDYSDEEIGVLSFSTKSYVKKLLIVLLLNKKYLIFILLMPLISIENYYNAFCFKFLRK